MSFLTGKASKSSSSSSNVNNGLITGDYSGSVAQGTGATNVISSLLTGTGNTAAANDNYQNYLQRAGYPGAMKALSQNITGQGAASGLLNSGATTKSLANYGTQLNSQYFQNYLQNLSGLSGLGTQAGSLIANTGQQSQSTGTGATPSLFSSIGTAAGQIGQAVGTGAAIFSDRRLKHKIHKVATYTDGLGLYDFAYIDDPQQTTFRGVMADEVERIRPWALGPKINGYQTVNYEAL